MFNESTLVALFTTQIYHQLKHLTPMNKAIAFKDRIIRNHFMEKLEHSSIRTELLASILEAYENRTRLKYSQKKYAELHKISIATLKRIELGICYDLILINRYCG